MTYTHCPYLLSSPLPPPPYFPIPASDEMSFDVGNESYLFYQFDQMQNRLSFMESEMARTNEKIEMLVQERCQGFIRELSIAKGEIARLQREVTRLENGCASETTARLEQVDAIQKQMAKAVANQRESRSTKLALLQLQLKVMGRKVDRTQIALEIVKEKQIQDFSSIQVKLDQMTCDIQYKETSVAEQLAALQEKLSSPLYPNSEGSIPCTEMSVVKKVPPRKEAIEKAHATSSPPKSKLTGKRPVVDKDMLFLDQHIQAKQMQFLQELKESLMKEGSQFILIEHDLKTDKPLGKNPNLSYNEMKQALASMSVQQYLTHLRNQGRYIVCGNLKDSAPALSLKDFYLS